MVDKAQIEEWLYWRFREIQSDFVNNGANIDANSNERIGYHVSDYSDKCMRRVQYNKEGGGSTRTLDARQLSTFWIGQVIHACTVVSNIGIHEVSMAYDFIRDKELPYDVPAVPEEDVLRGKVDDLCKVDGVYVIVDKKTWEYKGHKLGMYEPNDHYKVAMNEYRLLLDKVKGINAEWGCNIYVDLTHKDDIKVVPFAYKLEPVEKTMADILIKNKEIKDGKKRAEAKWKKASEKSDVKPLAVQPASGDYTERHKYWACDGYCPHLTRCSMIGDVKG